ncbi:MAG: hypothetical protein AB7Q29_18405 [Vicinamibacterales bacterium]
MDILPYHGVLRHAVTQEGDPCVVPSPTAPSAIPCPTTGHPLRIATIDAHAPAICPKCSVTGRGAFVSFVSDMRMAYACPQCRQFVWLAAV